MYKHKEIITCTGIWNFIDLRLFKKSISIDILITASSVSEWPNILWLPKEKKVHHVKILCTSDLPTCTAGNYANTVLVGVWIGIILQSCQIISVEFEFWQHHFLNYITNISRCTFVLESLSYTYWLADILTVPTLTIYWMVSYTALIL